MSTTMAFLCAFAASLSALSLGLDVGMISSTLVQPTFISYFNNPSSSATGGIVAAFSAGATFGAFGCAYIGDPFGRLWALRIGAIIAAVGCALQAGAVNIGMLIVGRLINGFGAGQLTAIFPVYASEVAPPAIRGSFGGLQMLMIEAAIFVATATGYGFGTHYTDTIQWRGPLAVQTIPLILLFPITFALPETPRWLVSKGKDEQALKVLGHLHEESLVQFEFDEIKRHLAAEKEMFKPTWMQIITKPSWRRRLLIVMGIQSFAQLTGINCVQYYAATIYTDLGYNTTESLRLNLIYGAFGLIFTIFWVAVLDRFRRVRILIVTTVLMAAALLVQSVLSAVYVGKGNANENALRAQVAMFFVFNLGFTAAGMLAWLIPPEMTPMSIRAKVNSISVSVNNIMGLVVAQVSPIALGAIGFKFFYVFFACNFLAVLFYVFCLPETSKLTLEEMDAQFGDQIIDTGAQGEKAGVTHEEEA